MFEIWILTTISFLLGYNLGKNNLTKSNLDAASRPLAHFFKKLTPHNVGAVTRPSAQTLYDRQNPKIAEGKEAMKEAFDAIKDNASQI